MGQGLQILLVDDHALFRDGVASILSLRMPGVQLHCVSDSGAADKLLREGHFDLVLLDIDLAAESGIAALTRWRRSHPNLSVVMLSASQSPQHIETSLALGARGFIPKTCSGALLAGALELVRAGGIYIPPQLLPPAVLVPTNDVEEASINDSQALTPRQIAVLRLLAEGNSNKEIARSLEMAGGTVRTHVNAIFRVLEASNRTQAVMRAQQLGWL